MEIIPQPRAEQGNVCAFTLGTDSQSAEATRASFPTSFRCRPASGKRIRLGNHRLQEIGDSHRRNAQGIRSRRIAQLPKERIPLTHLQRIAEEILRQRFGQRRWNRRLPPLERTVSRGLQQLGLKVKPLRQKPNVRSSRFSASCQSLHIRSHDP